MIEFQRAGVTATVGDDQVTLLHPTTLSLTEHRVSIIGANGSGKSTLVKLCNGLVHPTTGSVRVRRGHDGNIGGSSNADHTRDTGFEPDTDRKSSSDSTSDWFDTAKQGANTRSLVGFTFTNPSAQFVMPTAIEDVALSFRRVHKNKAKRIAAAHDVLTRFGLDPLADRSVHTLSGGQRQLLALASVLATDPAILVADEPTTLLDLRNSLIVRDLLMGLPQQVIVVTHDLEFAEQADRTLVVDNGSVVFDGEPTAAIHFYRSIATSPDDERSKDHEA